MSEEYGNDLITLTDEEGNSLELEHLDTMEYNDQTYMAFTEAVQSPEQLADENAAELIVLKVIEENNEEILATIDDEKELQTVFEMFVAHLEEIYAADENTADYSEKDE